ncbi:hypothetical protein A8O14_07825 [Polynucleobacter wuianus]|uniref:Uncharacterized protein n=1 Tax=Polynucleobacter wuianus TaxID=1743168 RepID=A0A191UG45_9BURK|nr:MULTISPECIES: hypothetical protein [Polynucleobacter]ANI99984.1 hypothetical protein A8O14_07825 [Polynucleobacter wuianus]MBU3552818.1 hypothetical protein [Polynucleobacter sp. MWH-Post4-6-1]
MSLALFLMLISRSPSPHYRLGLFGVGSGAQLRAPTHHGYFNTRSRTQTPAASGHGDGLPYC